MSYTISIEVLKQNSGKAAYERGLRVYQQGLVEDVKAILQKDTVAVSANILSSKQLEYYRTELIYNFKTKELEETYCDCPAFYEYAGLCKHCLALALKYNRMVNEGAFPFLPPADGQRQTSPALQIAMKQKATKAANRYQNKAKQVLSEPVQLIPILERSNQNGQWSVQFKNRYICSLLCIKKFESVCIRLGAEKCSILRQKAKLCAYAGGFCQPCTAFVGFDCRAYFDGAQFPSKIVWLLLWR